MTNLSNQREREALTPRREPYWHRISTGNYLGFRPGACSWHVRHRDRDGKQHQCSLRGIRTYSDAMRAAETWCGRMRNPATGTSRRGTVEAALIAYVRDLEDLNRLDAAAAALQRYESTIWADPLARIKLERLTREDVEAWRARLDNGERSPFTRNYYLRILIAGLNHALKSGWLADPAAWKVSRLQVPEADGQAAVFLQLDQRAALISAATPAAALFFSAMELTGARPGELAAATVDSVYVPGRKLGLAHRKGRNSSLKLRWSHLTPAAVAFFEPIAAGRAADEPLLRQDNGAPWNRQRWAQAFRAAAAAVNAQGGEITIPAGASAYSFRHARISELLQVTGLDPVSTAKETGTSVAMIERYYWRFIPAATRARMDEAREAGREYVPPMDPQEAVELRARLARLGG